MSVTATTRRCMTEPHFHGVVSQDSRAMGCIAARGRAEAKDERPTSGLSASDLDVT